MRYLNIFSNKGYFISNTGENFNNFSDELIVGNRGNDSFRTLLSFENNQLLNTDFYKCELVIYIKDIIMDENIESFMLNIGINLEDFSSGFSNWNNAPKIFEECHGYKIDRESKNNYIKLDLTSIMRNLVRHRFNEFAFTLIGFCDNSLINIDNCNKKRRAFLHFIYDDSVNNNEVIKHSKIIDNIGKNTCNSKNCSCLNCEINGDEIACGSKSGDFVEVDEENGYFNFKKAGVYSLSCYTENNSNELININIKLYSDKKIKQLFDCAFMDGQSTTKLKFRVIDEKSRIEILFNKEKSSKAKFNSFIKIIRKQDIT